MVRKKTTKCKDNALAEGDRVIVVDGSEAHGDRGIISTIQTNGIILVSLDSGAIWPCLSERELEKIEAASYVGYDGIGSATGITEDMVRRS